MAEIVLFKKRCGWIGLGFGISGVLIYASFILINLPWIDTPFVGEAPVDVSSFASNFSSAFFNMTAIGYVFLLLGGFWAGRRVAKRVLNGKDVFLSAFASTYLVVWLFCAFVILGIVGFEWDDLALDNLIMLLGLVGVAFVIAFFPACVFGPLFGLTLQRLGLTMGFEVKSTSAGKSPSAKLEP